MPPRLLMEPALRVAKPYFPLKLERVTFHMVYIVLMLHLCYLRARPAFLGGDSLPTYVIPTFLCAVTPYYSEC